MKDMKMQYMILKLIPVALLAVMMSGCVKDKFDAPEPARVWTEQEVTADGYTFMTIMGFKNKYFYDKAATDRNYDHTYYTTNSYGDRYYTYAPLPTKTLISDKVAIKGKVISTDRHGNLYRSLYIQDETGAIEIKVGLTGLYNDYPVGQMIYVKTDGLVLGNYRFMLSLGSESTDATYANGYIDLKSEIERTLLVGDFVGMQASDTIVVTASTVGTLKDPEDLGRLVRFEGITSKWGVGTGPGFSNSDVFPSFLQQITSGNSTRYISWIYESDRKWHSYENGASVTNVPWPGATEGSIYPTGYPTWAFKDIGRSFYGSALFVLGTNNYVVRTSGYSLFALTQLPDNGEVVNLTALYNKYCSSSGGYTKFQLLINSSNDVVDPATGKPAYYYDH